MRGATADNTGGSWEKPLSFAPRPNVRDGSWLCENVVALRVINGPDSPEIRLPLFPRKADSSRTSGHVRFVPILLQKSFLADEQSFSGPLMRSARSDVRDHIVLHKNDYGPSYRV